MNKILITGASGGIGSAIARKFNKNGFSLILTSSSKATLNILKNKYGDHHHYYVLNFNSSIDFQNSLKMISNDHADLF